MSVGDAVGGATGAGANAAVAGLGAPSRLEHAYLEIREPPRNDNPTPGDKLDQLDFQFNPRELSMSKKAKWNRQAHRDAPNSGIPQFGGAEPASIDVEMFLDASTKMDDKVVKTVKKLFECCVPTADSIQGRTASPPWVVFRWGDKISFPGYVSSVSVKYTLFTPTGTPVRATCTLKIEEIRGEPPKQNPTSGALVASHSHRVVAGDTLPSVAFRRYGDATAWRVLAEANEIDDPMRVPVGAMLLVPSVTELSAGRSS
jgi:nucleoid-associated protein YgaU